MSEVWFVGLFCMVKIEAIFGYFVLMRGFLGCS